MALCMFVAAGDCWIVERYDMVSFCLVLFVGDGSLFTFIPACTVATAALADPGLCLRLSWGIPVLAGTLGAVFPPISSIVSVSSSFKFDFQHITIASDPDVVKKSPFGEKLTELAGPS